MSKPEKLEQLPLSVLDEQLEKLKKMFPDLFTEGKLDISKMREVFG